MINKITEEQYQKLVEAWDSLSGYVNKTKEVIDYLIDVPNVGVVLRGDVAIALANPITREWAHDKFVEKEKKYMWQSKQKTDGGKVKRLYDSAIGITDSFMDKTEPTHNGNWITETEVKKWGYNPEMFDKEEV